MILLIIFIDFNRKLTPHKHTNTHKILRSIHPQLLRSEKRNENRKMIVIWFIFCWFKLIVYKLVWIFIFVEWTYSIWIRWIVCVKISFKVLTFKCTVYITTRNDKRLRLQCHCLFEPKIVLTSEVKVKRFVFFFFVIFEVSRCCNINCI